MIALSTASVYPETTANGFELASRLGYDAVEVMVGIDPISQETDAVRHLSDYHQVPVCAVHAPCLLITQRVWGVEPWGKLEQSAEMAQAVGADGQRSERRAREARCGESEKFATVHPQILSSVRDSGPQSYFRCGQGLSCWR